PLAVLFCPVAVLWLPLATLPAPHSVEPVAAPLLQSGVASARAGDGKTSTAAIASGAAATKSLKVVRIFYSPMWVSPAAAGESVRGRAWPSALPPGEHLDEARKSGAGS